MTPLTIRNAAAADAATVARLLGELGYPASPQEVAERMSRLSPVDDALLLAVDPAGRPVGLVAMHRMNVIHADTCSGYITAFVVEADARGSGVGRVLIQAAERWARAAGCRRLTVTSAEAREGAHAFYPAVGMPYTGRRYARTLD